MIITLSSYSNLFVCVFVCLNIIWSSYDNRMISHDHHIQICLFVCLFLVLVCLFVCLFVCLLINYKSVVYHSLSDDSLFVYFLINYKTAVVQLWSLANDHNWMLVTWLWRVGNIQIKIRWSSFDHHMIFRWSTDDHYMNIS